MSAALRGIITEIRGANQCSGFLPSVSLRAYLSGGSDALTKQRGNKHRILGSTRKQNNLYFLRLEDVALALACFPKRNHWIGFGCVRSAAKRAEVPPFNATSLFVFCV